MYVNTIKPSVHLSLVNLVLFTRQLIIFSMGFLDKSNFSLYNSFFCLHIKLCMFCGEIFANMIFSLILCL